ncbi:MAG TPA: CoA pyrophosphatase [Spirochaetota bacterium]|jgi:8-oxo-dGTP pyrophosphatase MutT (NUDIX family)|nr:CoA pyrophosphatase [Spirochaetota bacterium]HOK01845.1 CoA pyrophosphatase [Spirochaetota bacterium]HOK91964.1 CoA pyrophosphatase [Spirochaetota bacterium]HON15102.1 CoA pyrophosphatase [Spirochaetota bacterium]HOV08004.1 CoA pyrophosphatase [Spirochaetota bacterium]
MKLNFDSTYSFEDFKKEIINKLSSRNKRSIDFPDFRKSAVLMLFLEKNNSPHVVLTVRSDKVSTHKGQVAFPGGSHDEDDKDFLETALRETYEEIGLHQSLIEILGEYDEYISIMGFHVYVFVGALKDIPEYNICEDEIAELIEVPFSLFYNEEYTKTERVLYDGNEYDVYYYDYNGITIWGMTARILTDFSRNVCKS